MATKYVFRLCCVVNEMFTFHVQCWIENVLVIPIELDTPNGLEEVILMAEVNLERFLLNVFKKNTINME